MCGMCAVRKQCLTITRIMCGMGAVRKLCVTMHHNRVTSSHGKTVSHHLRLVVVVGVVCEWLVVRCEIHIPHFVR